MSTNPLPSPVPGQALVAGPPFPRPHRFLELSELQRCQLVRVDAVGCFLCTVHAAGNQDQMLVWWVGLCF